MPGSQPAFGVYQTRARPFTETVANQNVSARYRWSPPSIRFLAGDPALAEPKNRGATGRKVLNKKG